MFPVQAQIFEPEPGSGSFAEILGHYLKLLNDERIFQLILWQGCLFHLFWDVTFGRFLEVLLTSICLDELQIVHQNITKMSFYSIFVKLLICVQLNSWEQFHFHSFSIFYCLSPYFVPRERGFPDLSSPLGL